MAINFDSFTEGTTSNIQSNDYVVGFDTAVPGGERKFTLSTIANAVSGIMGSELNNAYLPKSGGDMTGMLGVLSVTESKATPIITANTLTLNLSSAVLFNVNLNSNITTFTLTNVPTSPKVYSFALQLSADGTSRSVVWPTGTRWSGASTPILTTTAGKVDTFTFLTHDGGSNWFAFTNNQNQ